MNERTTMCGIYLDEQHNILLTKSHRSGLWILPGKMVEDDQTSRRKFMALECVFLKLLNVPVQVTPHLLGQFTLTRHGQQDIYKVYRMQSFEQPRCIRKNSEFIPLAGISKNKSVSPAVKKFLSEVSFEERSNLTVLAKIA